MPSTEIERSKNMLHPLPLIWTGFRKAARLCIPLAAAWLAPFSMATPPTLTVSVTPNSGSGASQTFAFQYSDSNGYASLTNVYAGFGASAYAQENSCRARYMRAANQL